VSGVIKSDAEVQGLPCEGIYRQGKPRTPDVISHTVRFVCITLNRTLGCPQFSVWLENQQLPTCSKSRLIMTQNHVISARMPKSRPWTVTSRMRSRPQPLNHQCVFYFFAQRCIFLRTGI